MAFRNCGLGEVFQLFVIIFVVGYVHSCDTDEMLRCQTNCVSDMGDQTALSHMTGSDRTNLICRSYRTFKTCFDSASNGCFSNNPVKQVLHNLDDMYNYMCGTNREDFVKYSGCWLDKSVQDEITGCTSKYILPSNLQEPTAVCPYMRNIIGCSSDIVFNRCGKAAAAVFSNLNTYTQLMVYQLVSCPTVKDTFGSAENNPYKTGSRDPDSQQGVPGDSSQTRAPNGASQPIISFIITSLSVVMTTVFVLI